MSDIIVALASCFQYVDQSNGDTVITAKIEDYIKLIANKTCSLNVTVNTYGNNIAQLNKEVLALKNATPQTPVTLPSFYPIGLASQTTLLSLYEYVRLLEQSLLDLRGSTGTPQEIFNAIAATPLELDTAKSLGTSGGLLKSLPGWVQQVTNEAHSLQNLWLTIMDIRSAIRNIQLTCCNTTCDGIAIIMQATLSVKQLKLLFTGTIPSNMISCVAEGSSLKIADDSGNFIYYAVNVKAILNSSSGVNIDLSGSPLNFADDLKVSGIVSFCDPDSNSRCERYLELAVNNTTNCPTLTLNPTYDSLSYSFVHVDGTVTYSVQLFSEANVMLQSFTSTFTSPEIISGVFEGLSMGTTYKVRIQIVSASNTRTCPFTSVSTIENPCSAPDGVSATIEE
jgi:hypothetical protein